jgi:methyl-accepting chemotaxis protein
MSRQESVDTKQRPSEEDIRKGANKIRDSAVVITETLRALREGGAYKEIGAAVHEASVVARTIVQEIHATINDMEQSGAIKEVASAVKEVPQIARQTADTANAVATKLASEMEPGKTKKASS